MSNSMRVRGTVLMYTAAEQGLERRTVRTRMIKLGNMIDVAQKERTRTQAKTGGAADTHITRSTNGMMERMENPTVTHITRSINRKPPYT